MQKLKNKLLFYKGGGYDGCFWEWNFCLWDADGKWHNLFTSGCTGEPDIFSEELREYWIR